VENVFARLKTFEKAPGNRIGDYDLDANDSATMTVDFANGAMGVIHTSRWATGHLNDLRLRVHGDKGAIEVIHKPGATTLRVCLDADVENSVWRKVAPGKVKTNYQRFIEAILTGAKVEPGFRHAADLQRVLDLAIESDKTRRELALLRSVAEMPPSEIPVDRAP
jgi:predicted dehydrogenase